MKLFKLSLILFTVFQINTASNIQHDIPIVTTPYGKISGSYAKSYSGRIYSEFLSVPYAEPPVGELRFREPQPLQKWNGVWVANFTTECAQWYWGETGGAFKGQENCLYANIYVPKRDPSKTKELFDVIVEIHGGGLEFGSNVDYAGPKHIIDRDVILVTINYRLGPLGFLSTEDEVVPGNNGMKDQVAAMKWVKENIKHFGGNPDSITLTGLSAGGGSVHFHYMSPLSKGLFKAGISLSGTALCPWILQENALEKTRKLAAAVGCNQESTTDLVNCLKQRPATQIVEKINLFRKYLFNPFSIFGVVVEKHGAKPFLNEHPYKLLVEGKIQDLPWITSVVSEEGLFPVGSILAKEKRLAHVEKNWEYLASHILHYEHTVDPKLKKSIAQKIKKYYFDNKPISRQTSKELIRLSSDRFFILDAEKSARLQARANKSPTYFYYFSFKAETVRSFMEYMSPGYKANHGICHGDDLSFIYNPPFKPTEKLSETDLKMRDILLDIWISFIKTGKPALTNVKWDPVSNNPKEMLQYLHISSPDQLEMKKTNDLGNRQFWDTLKIQENEVLFPQLVKEEL